jgi:D-methionine transport system substrate-binding protein
MKIKFLSNYLWIGALFLLNGCGSLAPVTKSFVTTGNAPIEVTISGRISHTTYLKGQSGTVTFSRFPATVNEFKQVRELIGDEPHGAVALQLMAYEMYRRNRSVGQECIILNNTNNNVTMALGRLKELFGNDANYARPYQIAAFLKGATPQNGYNPPQPYTVQVRVNGGRPYGYSNDYQTMVLHLVVLTQGKDSGMEPVSVLKTLKPDETSEGKYFVVFSSSGVFSSVKAISFTSRFNGLK